MNLKHITKWTPHALGAILFAWMTWISGAVWNMNGDIHALGANVENVQNAIVDVKEEIGGLRGEISDVQKSLARIEGYLQATSPESALSPATTDSVGIAVRVSETY